MFELSFYGKEDLFSDLETFKELPVLVAGIKKKIGTFGEFSEIRYSKKFSFWPILLRISICVYR